MTKAKEEKKPTVLECLEEAGRYDLGRTLRELEGVLHSFRHVAVAVADATDAATEIPECCGNDLEKAKDARTRADFLRTDARFAPKAIMDLKKWVPDYQPGRLGRRKKSRVPFFSEAYLYELMGKEDARTLMALLNQLFEAVS